MNGKRQAAPMGSDRGWGDEGTGQGLGRLSTGQNPDERMDLRFETSQNRYAEGVAADRVDEAAADPMRRSPRDPRANAPGRSQPWQLLLFRLEERVYGLSITAVERVVNAVELTPLPGAPAAVLGAIDLAGNIVPVLDIRQRFGLPERDVRPSDQLVIARVSGRPAAFLIDEAVDVVERAHRGVTATSDVLPGLVHLAGLTTVDGSLVVIHDLDAFFSHEEMRLLDAATEHGL